MPDVRTMGSDAPLFAPREIETPKRRTVVSETSRAAWAEKHGKLRPDHAVILRYLADHGPSVHDSIVAAGLLPQSSSGRMGELKDAGMIEVIGEGKTRAGKRAKLCAITPAGREAINGN